MTQISLHPILDKGIPKDMTPSKGGTLVCKCTTNPVEVKVKSEVLHNHACGCTLCWKPEGAKMSIVGVVPTASIEVTKNGDKLEIVNPSATIQRHACKECKVHMYGPVEKDHAFKGLSFIHAELFQDADAPPPQFAAFVSSVIEGGVDPAKMGEVRGQLKEIGLPYYDCLAPGLMDALATFSAKKHEAYTN